MDCCGDDDSESKIEADKDNYESLANELESLKMEGEPKRNEPVGDKIAPLLRAVVLDNDETTGSYGIVFTLCHVLRKYVNEIDDRTVETIYDRLALHMIRYGVFRPHLAKIVNTLHQLKSEKLIEEVVMYTNQTEEMAYSPYSPFRNLVFNVPYTISYLMYSGFSRANIFDCVISRPQFFRTVGNKGVCIKSFSRVFMNYPGYTLDTEHVLFVDDNADPRLITASPKTRVHLSSYYKIPAYVRGLSQADLDEIVDLVFRDLPLNPRIAEEVKIIYHKYAPSAPNTIDDKELRKLNKVILNKYNLFEKKVGQKDGEN